MHCVFGALLAVARILMQRSFDVFPQVNTNFVCFIYFEVHSDDWLSGTAWVWGFGSKSSLSS